MLLNDIINISYYHKKINLVAILENGGDQKIVYLRRTQETMKVVSHVVYDLPITDTLSGTLYDSTYIQTYVNN